MLMLVVVMVVWNVVIEVGDFDMVLVDFGLIVWLVLLIGVFVFVVGLVVW